MISQESDPCLQKGAGNSDNIPPIMTMLILIFILDLSAADGITQVVFSLDDVSINSSLPLVFRHLATAL